MYRVLQKYPTLSILLLHFACMIIVIYCTLVVTRAFATEFILGYRSYLDYYHGF